MHKTLPFLSDKAIVISAVPYDAAKAYASDDKAKWCEFIDTHVAPLRTDLREHLPDSMIDPRTNAYRKGTPISGSLVAMHWFELDARHAFTEVLNHQLADAAMDETPGETVWDYDKMKTDFRTSIQLFWEQASWVALHLGTKYEMDFPHEDPADTHFTIVDSQLADLMFERAFCQMCIDDSAPYQAELKAAYKFRFGKAVDTKKLSGLDRDLAKMTPDFVRVCTDFWKLGGYTE